MKKGVFLVFWLFFTGFSTVTSFALNYPGASPGLANAHFSREFALENEAIRVSWSIEDETFRLISIENKITGKTYTHQKGEVFTLHRTWWRTIRASELELVGLPVLQNVMANPTAVRLAERFPGKGVLLHFRTKDKNVEVTWRAVLRNEANYVRQTVTFVRKSDNWDAIGVTLIDLSISNTKIVGNVNGSPAIADNFFFAYEHPMSRCKATKNSASCSIERIFYFKKDQAFEQSSVIGVFPQDQLRRAFLYYIERERPHPYRPFLHYNSWYHLNWAGANPAGQPFRKMNSEDALTAIQYFVQELIEARHTTIDAFAFDDGWDDPTTLWQFHSGFPNGFRDQQYVAERYHSALGAWLSPWGGYGGPKWERIQYGKREGFETNSSGFTLSGPKYYGRFLKACSDMIQNFGLKYFKFDGIGEGNGSGGVRPEYLDDIEGLLRLIGDLRKLQPEVFVNVTVGTWASPFWLLHSDSIWRNGDDVGWHGAGSLREQWITYRDMEARRNIVLRGPLYPLNSLMFHGPLVVEKDKGWGRLVKMGVDTQELKNEIRSFFGAGGNAQELYITPEAMTPEAWDALAEAANWARQNTNVLIDSHWVGGDPGKGQPYGFASWTPKKAILVLRNPNARSSQITIDVASAFELLRGAPEGYRLKSPWREDTGTPGLTLIAGQDHVFALKPFEVVVYEAEPL